MKNDQAHSLYDILSAPDKMKHNVRGMGGVLAHLWRSILHTNQISIVRFSDHCARYIQKARAQQGAPKIANYFNRANIFREMSRPALTFKRLLKGLQILEIKKLKITFEYEYRGKTYLESANILLIGDDAQYVDVGGEEDEKENGRSSD